MWHGHCQGRLTVIELQTHGANWKSREKKIQYNTIWIKNTKIFDHQYVTILFDQQYNGILSYHQLNIILSDQQYNTILSYQHFNTKLSDQQYNAI